MHSSKYTHNRYSAKKQKYNIMENHWGKNEILRISILHSNTQDLYHTGMPPSLR